MHGNYLRYFAVAVIVAVLVIVFLPRQSVVRVMDVQATRQEFGPPMVTATLANFGDETRVRYWIVKDRTDQRHCEGTVLLARKQSFALSFECPALRKHTWHFTLETGPAG